MKVDQKQAMATVSVSIDRRSWARQDSGFPAVKTVNQLSEHPCSRSYLAVCSNFEFDFPTRSDPPNGRLAGQSCVRNVRGSRLKGGKRAKFTEYAVPSFRNLCLSTECGTESAGRGSSGTSFHLFQTQQETAGRKWASLKSPSLDGPMSGRVPF